MKKEKIETLAFIFVGIAAFLFCFNLLIKSIVPVASPFIIAWFAAFAVREPSKKLAKKTHLSERFWRPALALFVTLIAFLLVGIIIWQLADFLWQLLSEFTSGGELYFLITRFSGAQMPLIAGRVPQDIAVRLNDGVQKILGVAFERLGVFLTGAVSFVPKALIFILITVIALIYFAVDLDKINSGVKSLFSEKNAKRLSKARADVFEIVGNYVRSYLLIMLITFLIMLFGFLILGIKRSFTVALMIAILDLLPILGVGIALVPWSIASFALGNPAHGIGILVIFVAYTVIRELLEPKILGKSLDTHPIITLISLYSGYAFFGVVGMIVFPIIAVLLCRSGKKDHTAKVG